MSRLSDLIRQAKSADAQLGADLEREFRALGKRRSFGLVFERHQPEAVELAGQPVRKGDKVRVLPPRGATSRGDQRLWSVTGFEGKGTARVAHLVEAAHSDQEAESTTALVADLVVVAEFRDHIYPGLVETGRVERGGGKPFHTVINAENFHALEMLTYTHRQSVDVIYIDPPYNSGSKDWKYNNDYVEADDDYRHSKWLAMMERRLLVARELLNPADAVLIVTIDEKEVHRLGLLLEQLFSDGQIQMVSTVINRKGNARRGEFSRCEEYLYLVRFGVAKVSSWSSNMLMEEDTAPVRVRWKSLLRLASTGRTSGRFNLFYPLFFDTDTLRFLRAGEPLAAGDPLDSVHVPEGESVLWPISEDGSDGRWSIGAAKLIEYQERGFIKFGGRNGGGRTPYYLMSGQIRDFENGALVATGRDADGALVFDTQVRQRQPMTIWNVKSHSTSGFGTSIVKDLLPGRAFPYPKSLYAVEDALRFFIADKPGAVVLDFFAGSGTTAHAVMRLNKQDGGRRQCISVTNNEVAAEEHNALRKDGLRPGDPGWEKWGICEYLTKPRIRAAITGTASDGTPAPDDYKYTDEFPVADGLEENAVFFTLTYEGPLSVAHHRAFARIAPMLWLRAGACGPIISEVGDKGWDLTDGYGVLDDLDSAARFVAEVKRTPGVATVYIVTDDDLAFQMVCRELPRGVRPVQLYESYLRNFEINSGRFA
ncbi:site-specific DNA-methyltransferase [Mycobacteroides salmoniphilum]|uniref:DNA methylase n=1 Tax=Mycobacteroides salmoniphilum TaxID=404941 RepID=A0A4R8SN53_9MYCO|nr:DNA methyltransferase [Mycobacteroides salmoniphilum]TDZ99778.1 DNA methylase [Mycobacteroides salmoniphilum]